MEILQHPKIRLRRSGTITFLFRLSVVVFSVVTKPATVEAAPRVQVRATSRLEIRAAGTRQRIQISGTLRDETGSPIPDAAVVFGAYVDSQVPIAFDAVGSCTDENAPTTGWRNEHTETTDSVGGFCFVGALARSEARFQAVFGGTPLHEGTRSVVLWSIQQQSLLLRFEPRPERIDLDAERTLIFGRAVFPSEENAHPVSLSLTGSKGQALATGATGQSGTVHFDFPSELLEGPGIGPLNLQFHGSDELAPANANATVTRTVHVVLSTKEDEVSGDPTGGIGLRVEASTSRGPAKGGTVEALVDHDVVGAAPVVDGVADLVLTFRPRRDHESYEVSLRYRPDAPFYEPSGTVELTLKATRPSPWLRTLAPVLVVVVGVWLLRGWWRPKRREHRAMEHSKIAGEPSLAIVRKSKSRKHWSGCVIDAHDGHAIAGARVRVVVPTFVELDTVVEELTDDEGRFGFEVDAAQKGLRLLVHSAYHAQIDKPLPPPSDVVINLVSRRRLLLDRLVKWARRSGRPWHRDPEPTPGHIERVANKQQGADAVARWAQSVQLRAFGPDPVNEQTEQEVHELEPKGQPLR